MRISTILLIISTVSKEIIGYFFEFINIFEDVNFDYEHIKLLLKVVGITICGECVCDILDECGEKTISNIVMIIIKCFIITLTIPLIKSIVVFCLKLIE